jgi:hypothetical protein
MTEDVAGKLGCWSARIAQVGMVSAIDEEPILEYSNGKELR